MRGTQLSALLADEAASADAPAAAGETPVDAAGIGAALELVSGFDTVLVGGLARLGAGPAAALTALGAAVAGTPLGPRVGEAVEKTIAGSVDDECLAALAAARAALLAAVHDERLDRLDTALGRARAVWGEDHPIGAAAPAVATDAEVGPLLAGCRSWLLELALTGWRGVDHDLLEAVGPLLAGVLAAPGLRRLAVLLDGFAAELRACCPVATAARIPVRRWADLWSRAVLLTRPGALAAGPGTASDCGPAGPVSGRLLPLGVDVHEHATAVQIQLHGVLEPTGGGAPLLVRVGLTAMKVDTITGPVLWRLFSGYPVLLETLAAGRAVQIAGLELLRSGDLCWDENRVRPADPTDPFTTARVLLAGAVAPAVPPLWRDPVRIAEPVLLEGYTMVEEAGATWVEIDGRRLGIDLDRLPSCGPLTPRLVATSAELVGLLRAAGPAWSVQPLAVRVSGRRGDVTAATADWALGPTDPKIAKALARTGDTVAVLRERAGRLLRQ